MTITRSSVVILLASVLLLSCGRTERDPATLIVLKPLESTNLDPAAFVHAGDLSVISECYQRLISQTMINGHPTGAFQGELAESWEVSDDGRSYTFVLQEEARFDDGTPVDAQAVKWSFERLKSLNRTAAFLLSWIDKITVLNERTIQFQSEETFAAALATLAYSSSVVMNPKMGDKFESEEDLSQWFSSHSAGSGPYKVKLWERGNRIVLERNPHFAGQQPHFKKVVMKAVADPSSRRIQLRKGDVDLSLHIASTNAHYYESLDNINLHSHSTETQPGFWVTNMKHDILSDARLRYAIAHAIDYQGLINNVMDGNAQRVTSLVPEGVIGHIPALLNRNYNPDRARALIAEAGFSDGLELKLLINLMGPVSEALQAFMAEVGIRLTLEVVAPVSFYDRVRQGDFDLAYTGDIIDFLDPWAILRLWYHSESIAGGTNLAGYSNPELDKLLNLGDTSIDTVKRQDVYEDAQRIISKDLPYIHLFSAHVIFATGSDIGGIDISPLISYRLNLSKMHRVDQP